ncbi:MAG TPA: DHH family phosphoesterase [Candidatus Bathyarchaeia archaeon]|nr:DHH family phosphoesterase [Candidatus Bathyarchaeia archaeon]
MQPHFSSQSERRLELERAADLTASVIKEAASKDSTILAVTHFDADGLTAGAIAFESIKRLNTTVHLRIVENLSDKTLQEIASIDADFIVFTDIGSGYLDLVSQILKNREIVIADHHQALGEAPPNLHHFNTHLFGFNGSEEISGAGTSYLLAKAVDKKNVDLSPLAVVGCLGDQQDKGPKRALRGLNAEILDDAVQAKLIDVTQDLVLFGRQTRPIHRAISSTTTPFLPGLSGEEDHCLALLDSVNIPTKIDDRWRTISDLSLDEKKRLVDKIIQHVISLKLSGEVALELIGAVYTLKREEASTPLRDGREYASLLNACGRMGKPSLGVALGLGDRGASFDEAQQVYSDYRKWLSKYMNWITQDPRSLVQKGHLVIVRGEGVIDENMTGAVSSIISSSNLFGGSKVTLVVTSTREGETKVSARGTDQLIEKGLNLGKILQDLSPKYGGYGGGHAIAAGATIERQSLEPFLTQFEKTIELSIR